MFGISQCVGSNRYSAHDEWMGGWVEGGKERRKGGREGGKEGMKERWKSEWIVRKENRTV